MSAFVPEPTCREFMLSDAYVSVLAGPIGSSKSVTAVHRLVQLAAGQAPDKSKNRVRRTRALIVRNTSDQLALTTRKTVFDWLPPGQAGSWHATEKTFVIVGQLPDGTTLRSEWLFIALDTPDDVRKALSLEATFLWGNEARELEKDVIDGLLGRINRYPSLKDGGATRACAIFDTNMPDEETYWHEQMEKPPSNWKVYVQPPAIISPESYRLQFGDAPTVITTSIGEKLVIDPAEPMFDKDGERWVINPRAENLRNLKADYYPNLLPGKTSDWLRVYLRSVYGRSLSGTPVYEKSFTPDFHIAKGPLTPVRGSAHPIGIGHDFGRTPAAVFKQRDPRGRILTLGEVVCEKTESMGLETFISRKLKPYIARRFVGHTFYVAPDPAGYEKQQQNELALTDILKSAGLSVVPKGTISNDPAKRLSAVERLLALQIDGAAAYLVDPTEAPTLIKGFRYGYRYKINKTGSVADTPDKNEYSHVHDANQYIDMVIDLGIRGAHMGVQARDVMRVKFAT